jgi:WhiB family transcriptional regulator, redox-sensing transcriptional regulator
MAKKPTGVRSIEDFDIFNSDENSWRNKAACRGVATSVFFGSPKSADIANAKSICNKCTVNAHCLKSALTYQYHGVWGNTTEEERSYIFKKILDNDISLLDLNTCAKLVSLF